MKRAYKIKAKVWLYPGKDPWHFVTLPKKASKDIDFYFAHAKRGWGSIRVTVTLGKTSWKTSIFPDKKKDSYILPLKAQVRKEEEIKEGDYINFSLELED